MARTQFTFYESWYRAIKALKKKSEQADLFIAICEYALYDREPEISGPPAAVFESIRPALDTARKKSENAKKRRSKPEANEDKPEKDEDKPEEDENKPDANESKDEARNRNRNSNSNRTICYPSSLPSVEKKEEGRPAGRFAPPSVEEVAEAVREKGYHVDPEAFVAFYASKGWKVGSAPMKDWKAALTTWEKREQKDAPSSQSQLEDWQRRWEAQQEELSC